MKPYKSDKKIVNSSSFDKISDEPESSKISGLDKHVAGEVSTKFSVFSVSPHAKVYTGKIDSVSQLSVSDINNCYFFIKHSDLKAFKDIDNFSPPVYDPSLLDNYLSLKDADIVITGSCKYVENSLNSLIANGNRIHLLTKLAVDVSSSDFMNYVSYYFPVLLPQFLFID